MIEISIKKIWSISSIAILLTTSIAFAANESNREIAKTLASFHLKQREFLAGALLLTDHLKSDPADTDAWNLLGLLYLEANRPDYAVTSFERAASAPSLDAEDRAIFKYNLANALQRSKKNQEAQRLLQEINNDSTTPSQFLVASNAALKNVLSGQSMRKLDSDALSSTASPWGVSIALGGGYDSNILLYSDALLADGTSTTQASPSGNISSSVDYEFIQGEQLWTGRAQASFTDYSKQEVQTYNSLGSSVELSRASIPNEFAKKEMKLKNRVDFNLLNTDGIKFYNWTDTLETSFLTRHNSRLQTEITIPALYQKYSTSDSDDPLNDRTGFGISPSFTLRSKMDLGTFSGSLRYEGLLATGDNYKSHALALAIGHEHTLPYHVGGRIHLEPSLITYPSSSTSRKDSILTLGYGLSKKLSSSTFLTLDYSYKRSVSSEESATYAKHGISLWVIYELL